jgi:uncharacterized protein YecA (UPF0149 family)
MWKKYMPNWSPGWFYRKPKSKEFSEIPAELKERMNSLKEIEVDPLESFNEDKIDFIQIEQLISLEDQCPCGSGKKFKDCHYQEGMETNRK